MDNVTPISDPTHNDAAALAAVVRELRTALQVCTAELYMANNGASGRGYDKAMSLSTAALKHAEWVI